MFRLNYLITASKQNKKEKSLLPRYRPNLKTYNKKLCAKCGGKCCKSCGCHFSPRDFKDLSFEALKKEIEKGYISIDCIPEEICYKHVIFGVLILRVRNIDSPIVDACIPRKLTGCIFLTPLGCLLSNKDRPTGGKALIPRFVNNQFRCSSNYDIYECSCDWYLYQDTLKQLLHYFKNFEIDYPCNLL